MNNPEIMCWNVTIVRNLSHFPWGSCIIRWLKQGEIDNFDTNSLVSFQHKFSNIIYWWWYLYNLIFSIELSFHKRIEAL